VPVLPKSHAFHSSDPFLVPIWCFGCDFSVSDAVGVASVCPLPLRPCPRSMEALDCAPDAPGRRSRSPSPDAALRPSPTTPVCGTGWEQSAVTPSTDAYNALAEASCKACESASKRLKHTCTKAKHTGKRHTSPSVDIRHAKRSGTGPAAALTAPEAVQIPVASLAIDRGSSDVGVRAGEMHVLSEALSHISSSSEALHPSHLPVPTLIMEQGEASDVDGDLVMAEGNTHTRAQVLRSIILLFHRECSGSANASPCSRWGQLSSWCRTRRAQASWRRRLCLPNFLRVLWRRCSCSHLGLRAIARSHRMR